MRFALAFATLVGLASGAEAALVVSVGFGADGFRSSSRSAAGDPGQTAGAVVVPDWSALGAGPNDNLAPQWSQPPHSPLAGPIHSSPMVLGVGLDNAQRSAVPDATSWGLLLAGFGLVGVVARRRRDTRSVTA